MKRLLKLRNSITVPTYANFNLDEEVNLYDQFFEEKKKKINV